jgi:hypothetical protein
MEEELIKRILKLENELKSTKYLVIFLIMMFIVLAYQYITVRQKDQLSVELIRTRGLILQDENGRDVMLMGYPVPYSKQRKRTDGLEGLLWMDVHGNDRLFMGSQGSLQVNGELYSRIDAGWGFLVNDQLGNERGGFGILDSLNSMVLGLNYPAGEGIVMVTEPDHAFMVFNADTDSSPRERIVLSHTGNGEEKTLIRLGDNLTDDRILICTARGEDPALEYLKRNGIKNNLFR